MGRLQAGFSAGIFALAVLSAAEPADATSPVCARLEARLAALDSRPSTGRDQRYQDQDRTVRRLRNELDRAEQDARRAGCLRRNFFQRRRAQANCGAVMASIDRLRAKLNRATAARDGVSGDPFSGGREQAELRRALADHDCGDQYRTTNRPRRGRGFFAQLFGGNLFRDRRMGRGYDGTYRTLCVRTCDGYYFPISFSTVRSRFATDEMICRSRCPDTEVALYVHRNPGQESDAMVSLAGEPYIALPTAYKYRKQYDSSCACGQIAAPATATTEVAGLAFPGGPDPWGFARGAESLAKGGPPIPIHRPTIGEDPETTANRAGGFEPKTVDRPEATYVELMTDGEKTIRVVGPTQFYAQ